MYALVQIFKLKLKLGDLNLYESLMYLFLYSNGTSGQDVFSMLRGLF